VLTMEEIVGAILIVVFLVSVVWMNAHR